MKEKGQIIYLAIFLFKYLRRLIELIGQTIPFNCNKKSMTSYSLNTVQITALESERKILKKNGVNTCNVWFEKISISPPPPTEGIGFSRGKGASICLIFQWEAGGGGGGGGGGSP